ncbi:hypothetical protein GQ457_15G011020 [Hibiscus cannabinus]
MIHNRRQLTPAQRSAKIERDRRRRRERNMEFERLRNAEMELQGLVAAQRNEYTSLRGDNERLNDMVSKLQNTINQLRDQNRELHQKNLGLEQTMELADSWFAFDKSSSPNEEAANNEPITEGSSGSRSGIPYAKRVSELVIDQHTMERNMLRK